MRGITRREIIGPLGSVGPTMVPAVRDGLVRGWLGLAWLGFSLLGLRFALPGLALLYTP